MAKSEQEIRDLLHSSLKSKPITVLASVKSVDTAKRTCSIDDDGVVMYGVRLQPITQGSAGITIYPKVGAQVLCAKIEEGDDYMLLHASEIDKIEATVDSKSLVLDKNGVVVNDGSIGCVKADKMVEWMMKVYSDLQTLVGLLSSSAVKGNGAPLAIAFAPTTPQPQVSDFADDAFKH